MCSNASSGGIGEVFLLGRGSLAPVAVVGTLVSLEADTRPLMQLSSASVYSPCSTSSQSLVRQPARLDRSECSS